MNTHYFNSNYNNPKPMRLSKALKKKTNSFSNIIKAKDLNSLKLKEHNINNQFLNDIRFPASQRSNEQIISQFANFKSYLNNTKNIIKSHKKTLSSIILNLDKKKHNSILDEGGGIITKRENFSPNQNIHLIHNDKLLLSNNSSNNIQHINYNDHNTYRSYLFQSINHNNNKKKNLKSIFNNNISNIQKNKKLNNFLASPANNFKNMNIDNYPLNKMSPRIYSNNLCLDLESINNSNNSLKHSNKNLCATTKNSILSPPQYIFNYNNITNNLIINKKDNKNKNTVNSFNSSHQKYDFPKSNKNNNISFKNIPGILNNGNNKIKKDFFAKMSDVFLRYDKDLQNTKMNIEKNIEKNKTAKNSPHSSKIGIKTKQYFCLPHANKYIELENKKSVEESNNSDDEINEKDEEDITESKKENSIIKNTINSITKKSHSTKNKIIERNINDKSNIMSSEISSTVYDCNYYMNESNKLSKYIKEYYEKKNKYPNTNINFYKYGRKIGQGGFGKVNLGLHILSGRTVAIKSFNKEKYSNEKMKKIFYEMNLMKSLNHKNITKILELFENEKYIFIIMEYINGGNLFSYVKKRRKLSEKTTKFIFKQIILGIKEIHSKNIVHRDIKLENILIDLNNNVKICDFGIGCRISSPDQILHDRCGTPIYMAPEILQCNKKEGYIGFPVDIWSSGISLYLMLSGDLPFKENENKKNIINSDDSDGFGYSVVNDKLKTISNVSKEANDLIKGLLNKNPKKRLNCDQILKHPWLKDVNVDNNKHHLFTKIEKVMLSKTYVDYRINQNDNLKENFTLSNLYKDDKSIEKEIKNNLSKSLIYTPFNTYILNLKCKNASLCDSKNKNIKIENDIINIGNKVKEFNIRYEMNNNGEVDNGMMIKKSTNNSEDSISSILNKSCTISNKKNILKKASNNEDNAKKERILNELEKLGYNKKYILKCLDDNEFCYATAAYFLMMNYDGI